MFAAPVGGTDITADCSVGPRTPAFYEMKAKGGAASVTASELVVHPATDASHMFHLNLTTPGNLASWTWVADAIMRHGAISQFTLYGDTKKSNRPSFIEALSGPEAVSLYEYFNECLRELGLRVETGIFGADMKIELVNDGPVTIILENS